MAMAAIAATVWIPVALMPWPKAMVLTAIGGIRRGSASAPRASPGRPRAVFSPKPKARRPSISFCLPSFSPILAAQMFEDSRSTAAGVAQSTGCVSWMARPPCSQSPCSQ